MRLLRLRGASHILLLALLYFVAAQLGMMLSTEAGVASVVWPPSGCAVAALMARGRRLWPGVFFGALVVNLVSHAPTPAAFLMAMGSTVEPLFVCWWLRRKGWHDNLNRLQDVLQLGGANLTGCLISAVCSAVALSSFTSVDNKLSMFLVWWLGDAIGTLILLPAAGIWRSRPRPHWPGGTRGVEVVLMSLSAVGVNVLIFVDPKLPSVFSSSVIYLLFPMLLWATVRFGQRGAATANLVTSMIAVSATAANLGPFMGDVQSDRLMSLQMFLGIVVVSVLILGAVIEERAQAVRLRDDFLFIASHELKTPLTALQLSLQNLERLLLRNNIERDTPILRKLGSAHLQVKRMGTLVEELLDVARITDEKLTLQLNNLDLSALTQEVAARFSEHATRAGCLIEVETPQPADGLFDGPRVEQVVHNLLSNAIKYGAGKPVRLRVWTDTENAYMSVSDSGIGICTQDRSRIFDRFERAVSARNYGGLGLGLHVARQIVHAHGGSIKVDSEPGQGSTFFVILPRRGAAPAPSAGAWQGPAAASF